MQRPPVIFSWLRFVAFSFLTNRGLLLASSLSYTTVLSLVPLLAVAFSLAKGFGIYEAPFLRNVLLRLTAEKTDVVDAVLGYIQNTNVKALGFIGVATLFITSVSLLSTMEEAFNIIWHAKTRRGLWSRFTNYVTVILVCPVFILAAFSVTATLQSASVVHWLREIELVHRALTVGLKALPMVMISISLFILYKFLPNVRVSSRAAVAGAATAGICWQSTQTLYIRYQIGATGYNAIYGSFAQIPLLLIWLYISWLIVLAGAEIANACQNFFRIRHEDMVRTLSVSDRRDLSLLLALMLAERTEKRGAPLADSEAADHLGMPLKLVDQELKKLVRIGTAVRVDGDEDAEGENGSSAERYILAVPPDRLTVGELVVAWEGLRNGGRGDGPDTGEMSDLAERFPELSRIKERLNAACLDGSAQTLREAWLAMRPADSEN